MGQVSDLPVRGVSDSARGRRPRNRQNRSSAPRSSAQFIQRINLLTRADENPRRLRQSSPFCGILSPEERLAILKDYESRRA